MRLGPGGVCLVDEDGQGLENMFLQGERQDCMRH